MPPHILVPADRTRTSSTSTLSQDKLTVQFKVFFLALVVITGLRIAMSYYPPRKRRMSSPTAAKEVLDEKASNPYQGGIEKDLRQSASLKIQDQQTPAYKPIYPWTSPPHPLPGPYDPHLYPLPTLRRLSYDSSTEDTGPGKSTDIHYNRRISMDSVSNQQSTLRGTITISSKGWRRNQWTISGK